MNQVKKMDYRALSEGKDFFFIFDAGFNLSGCTQLGVAYVDGKRLEFGIYDATLNVNYGYEGSA